jgi:hypothetical protein
MAVASSAAARSLSSVIQFLQKPIAFGSSWNGEAMKPPKGTFPHVVTTPREVSGSYHHQRAEQRRDALEYVWAFTNPSGPRWT